MSRQPSTRTAGSRRWSVPRTSRASGSRRGAACTAKAYAAECCSTGAPGDRIVYARLATDVPVSDPGGFRSLLNSFLPRKRAISQLLVRDTEGRVLVCELTYKRDWDLPGGVVEVGESPKLAVAREVREELGLDLEPGELLLTDWLPPWGGWDDAVCLVFDGGVHDASILDTMVRQEREIRAARFCTVDEVRTHCADFTARRIEQALRPRRRRLRRVGSRLTTPQHLFDSTPPLPSRSLC